MVDLFPSQTAHNNIPQSHIVARDLLPKKLWSNCKGKATRFNPKNISGIRFMWIFKIDRGRWGVNGLSASSKSTKMRHNHLLSEFTDLTFLYSRRL